MQINRKETNGQAPALGQTDTVHDAFIYMVKILVIIEYLLYTNFPFSSLL